jgi:D-alanine-D-alanine ligase
LKRFKEGIMKTRVAMIFGGKSVEHEVSVISGIQAILSMDTDKYDVIPVYMTKKNEMYVGGDIGNIEAYKDINSLLGKSQRVIMINEDGRVKLTGFPVKKFGKNYEQEIDIAFPVVHGTNVEDGAFQGYLKTMGIPFVGCDVTASAIGMDKFIMKAVLKEGKVPVLDAGLYTLSDYADMEALLDKVEKETGYPAIVKPVNLGSSVGISVAKNRVELTNSIDDAFRYATKVLVEHAITRLREINCAVLGDENEAIASEVEEPLHTEDILSYEDKYVSNSKSGGSKGMASVSRKIPAEISPKLREEIRDMAVRSFKLLGCNGVSRIDFMIDEENDKLYFNEINTIPGSLSFYLWEPIGIPYKELLSRMIELCLKRARQEESLTFTFDTNILNSASFGGSKGGAKL